MALPAAQRPPESTPSRWRRNALAAGGVVAAWAALAPLMLAGLGWAALALVTVPVIASGALLGTAGGVVAALVAVPLLVLLQLACGGWAAVTLLGPQGAMTAAALAVAGLAAGRLRHAADTARQKATQAEDARDQHRRWLDAAGDGVCGVDAEGRVVYLNTAAARMLGWEREAAFGQAWDRVLPAPPSGPGSPRAKPLGLREVLTHGKRVEGVRALLATRAGGVLVADVTIAATLADSSGRGGAVVTFRDVGESGAEMPDAGARDRTVLDALGEAVAITRGERRLVVNRAFAQLYGYASVEAALAVPVGHDVVEADRARVIEVSYGDPAAHGMVEGRFFFRIRRRDGEVRAIESRTSPIEYAGQPAVVSVLRDVTDRLAVEEALRQSEARLRTILNNAPIGVALVADDGAMLAVNHAFEAMTGKGLGEAGGLTLLPAGSGTGSEQTLSRLATRRDGTGRGEWRLTGADGRQVRAAVTVLAAPHNAGHAAAYSLVMLEDVTERRQAEEALRESEATYRALVEQLSDGLSVTVGRQRMLANPAYLRMFGFTDEAQALNTPLGSLVVPEDQERVFASIRRMQEQPGLVQQVAYQARRVDGTVRQFDTSVVPVSYRGQLGALALLRDVTEQRQAEAALRESEARLRAVFHGAAVGVIRAALDGRLVDCNPAFERMVGYSLEELRETSYERITHQDDVQQQRAAMAELAAGRTERFELEKRYRRSDGADVWAHMAASLIRDDAGAPQFIIAIIEDVTKRRMAEEALRESEERWRSVVENAPGVIATLSRGGEVLSVNRPMGGLPPAQLLGTRIFDCVPLEQHGRLREALEHVFEDGEPDGFETALGTGRGAPAWTVMRLGPIRKGGHVAEAILVATDVTGVKRAEEAARRRSEELAALAAVSSELAQPGEFDQRALRVVKQVAGVLQADRVSLRVPEQGGTKIISSTPLSADQVHVRSMPADTGIGAEVLRSGMPVLTDDYPAHPHAIPEAVWSGSRSLAAVPVLVEGRVVGVLLATSKQRQHFTPDRLRLLTAIANAIGAHLENERLDSDNRRRTQEMEALYKVASAMARPATFADKAGEVVREIAKSIGAASVGFGVPEYQAGGIRFVALAGPMQTRLASMPVMSFETTVSGRAFSGGAPVVVNDYAADPLAHPSLVTSGVRSCVAVPVKAGGAAVAVLTMSADVPNRFTPEMVKFLVAVGEGMGTLVENARLYQEVRNQLEDGNRRLEAFHAAAARLTLEADPDVALRHLLEVACRMSGAEAGAVAVWDAAGGLARLAQRGMGVGYRDASREPLARWLRTLSQATGPVRAYGVGSPDDGAVPSGGGEDTARAAYLGVPLRLKDGHVGVLCLRDENRAQPFSDLDERMLSLFGAMAGILLDNMRLYDAERRERDTLAAVQASMTEGLVVADAEGRIRYWNPAALAVCGLKARHVEGRTLALFLDQHARFVRERGALDWLAYCVRHGDGAAREVIVELERPARRDLAVTVFRIGAGRGDDMTGLLLRDVTQERDLERRRATFVSVASHELRTPITTILGFSELLLDREPAAPIRRQWINMIHQDSRRVSAIVDDMLNVSRIQSGRMRVERAVIDFGAVAQEVAGTMRSRTANHRITVDAADLPPVLGDRDKLAQVLINLIDNAVKYSPDGGKVMVRAWGEPERGRLVVTVTDEGIGIAPEDQAGLFTTFHRVHRPETDKIRGTGLGLYIVKALVEMMDGEIWLVSTVGKGTTFSFTLPLGEGDTSEAQAWAPDISSAARPGG